MKQFRVYQVELQQTIAMPSRLGLWMQLIAVMFAIGMLAGYTFNELNTFNARVNQVVGSNLPARHNQVYSRGVLAP